MSLFSIFSVPKKHALNLKARFENMAQQTSDDAKQRSEDERKRREAREKKEREEAKKREDSRQKEEEEAERKKAAEELQRLFFAFKHFRLRIVGMINSKFLTNF